MIQKVWNPNEVAPVTSQKLDETKEELFNLRFQLATGQLENNSRVRILRKDVARINTLMREREIAAAEALAGK